MRYPICHIQKLVQFFDGQRIYVLQRPAGGEYQFPEIAFDRRTYFVNVGLIDAPAQFFGSAASSGLAAFSINAWNSAR